MQSDWDAPYRMVYLGGRSNVKQPTLVELATEVYDYMEDAAVVLDKEDLVLRPMQEKLEEKKMEEATMKSYQDALRTLSITHKMKMSEIEEVLEAAAAKKEWQTVDKMVGLESVKTQAIKTLSRTMSIDESELRSTLYTLVRPKEYVIAVPYVNNRYYMLRTDQVLGDPLGVTSIRRTAKRMTMDQIEQFYPELLKFVEPA